MNCVENTIQRFDSRGLYQPDEAPRLAQEDVAMHRGYGSYRVVTFGRQDMAPKFLGHATIAGAFRPELTTHVYKGRSITHNR